MTMGYQQINNPCDFIIYKYPNILYLECKAVHGNTLNFKSDIRENQWDRLLKYSEVEGVNAGILCWFIDLDLTIFLDIYWLQRLKELNYKSFNAKNDLEAIPTTQIKGVKKRLFFNYDLEKFLEEIAYEI